MNRSPTKALVNNTPKESWIGIRPDVNIVRIFCNVAYAYVLDEKITKMERKSIKCIFIGYSREHKAYKLYDPKVKKLLVSRYVIFDEDGIYIDEAIIGKNTEVVINLDSNTKEE